MSDRRRTSMWAAVLQGNSGVYHGVHYTRRSAIAAVVGSLGDVWPALRRNGWYVTRVTIEWSEPR